MAKYTTISDCGGVKIGNEHFSVIVPNGYGDGETNVYVFIGGSLTKDDPAHYFGAIKGDDIKIYGSDCSDDPDDVVATISGSYWVYYFGGNHNGNVYLIENSF